MLYSFIGCAIIFLLFVFVYTRQPKGERVSLLTCAIAMLLGAIPCFFLAFFFQILTGVYIGKIGIDPTVVVLIVNFLIVALSEELLKYIAGTIISKNRCKSRINYITVFAAVGTGFDIMESSMQMTDVLSVIVRCVLAIHISLQIVMGAFYSKDKKILALVVPILIHGVYDYGLSSGFSTLFNNPSADDALIIVGVAVGAFAFLIWSLSYANSIGKEEKKVETTVEK